MVEPITADGFGPWVSKLPARWVSEGVARARSSTGGDAGHPRWKFEIFSKDNRFFGLRPGLERVFLPGRTCRFTATLTLLEARNVGAIHTVVREWGPNGNFLYQVSRLGTVSPDRQTLSVYLTVREGDRVLDPVLLLESVKAEESAATLIVDELRLDEV